MIRMDTVDVFQTAQTATPNTTPSSCEPTKFWGVLVCLSSSLPPTTLTGSCASCGRLSSNRIVVNDERVSSVHFDLYVDEQKATYWLLDKSRNGTFINHKRVGCGRRCHIQSGDEIEVVLLPAVRSRVGDGTEDTPPRRYVTSFMFHGCCHVNRPLSNSPAESMTWTDTAPVGDDPLSEEPSAGRLNWQWGSMIGKGAFSEVYIGIETLTGKMIAVKVLSNPSGAPSDGDSLVLSEGGTIVSAAPTTSQLKRKESSSTSEYYGISPDNRAEMKLLRSLRHRRIVHYIGFARQDDSLCILLEYVAGGSLHSLISNFGSFLEPVVRIYSLQILQGLEFLHSMNVVHGDIKPMNILVSDKGQVKLSDFGTSKFISATGSSQEANPQSGFLVGTPAYMSPELVATQKSTFASDIWAFGCVVFEMVTGVPPWDELGTREVAPMIFAIGNTQTGPSLALLDERDVSDALKDFVRCCFAIPSERRPTATQLLQHRFFFECGRRSSTLATDMPPPAKVQGGVEAAGGTDPSQPPILSPHLNFLHQRVLSEVTPRSQLPPAAAVVHRHHAAASFPSAPIASQHHEEQPTDDDGIPRTESSGLTSKFRVLEAV